MSYLKYEDRCLRTHTGKLLFGPVGRRLWVDYLDRKPGFCGRIDFIHKTNLTELFQVVCDREIDWELARSIWRPDWLSMENSDRDVYMEETKSILFDDLAFSQQKWKNECDKPLTLTLQVAPEGAEVDGMFFSTPELSYGYRVGGVCGWTLPGTTYVLEPGEQIEFVAACQVGNLSTETREELEQKLDAFWEKYPHLEDALHAAEKEWQDFQDKVPTFYCSNPIVNAAWSYRWFIMRHCTAYPAFGNLQHAVMYEGRSHRMNKTPFVSQGWEFTKLIPLSTPLHVTDYRWSEDHEIVREFLRSFFDSADENGIPRCTVTNGYLASYANYGIWAVYQLYLLDGNQEFLREVLPAMKAYIAGHIKVHGDAVDALQIEYTHSRTGKEYQPSYWYFHDYPKNPKDKSTYTPLKRVDRSVYHYLNTKGLAAICRILQDPDQKKYEELAEKIAADINQKMWDQNTHFYYDLHYQTDEKAMVKNIVGFYPYWAEISDDEKLPGLEYLKDPAHFNTGSAFPSVSKENPAYSPDGGWQGIFIKGRNGCVWDGPSWPYTTGIALSALGRQSQLHGHKYDRDFWTFFRQYTAQHFRDGVLERPYLVEHYNPESGEPLSDEVDYNHSYWIDLVMSFVAGIHVEEDKIIVDPLQLGLQWFTMRNVLIRGHRYAVSWAEKENIDAVPVGMKIMRDGETIFESDVIEKVEIVG